MARLHTLTAIAAGMAASTADHGGKRPFAASFLLGVEDAASPWQICPHHDDKNSKLPLRLTSSRIRAKREDDTAGNEELRGETGLVACQATSASANAKPAPALRRVYSINRLVAKSQSRLGCLVLDDSQFLRREAVLIVSGKSDPLRKSLD
jgi:hypothetical protein